MLVPGDPFRTPLIAKHLEDAHEVAFSREYRTFTGRVDGETFRLETAREERKDPRLVLCDQDPHGRRGEHTAHDMEMTPA